MPGDDVKQSVFRRALRSQRRRLFGGGALFAAHQSLEVAVPVVIGAVIDQAVATGDGGSLARWIALLVGVFVCLSAAGCTGLYIEEKAVTGAAHWARMRVAERVLAPGGGAESATSGQIVSLSTVETARIGEGTGAVILGVGAVTGLLVGAGVLLATSVPIGLTVVLGVPVVMLVVQALSAPLVVRAEAHQEAVGRSAGVAADLLRGLRVLKGIGGGPAAGAAYRRSSASTLRAALDATRLRSAYTGLTFTVAGAFLVVVAWIGGHQALEGDITIGELVAAIGLTQFLLGPLGRLALTGEVLAQARSASDRIGAALDAPPAVTGGSGVVADAPAGVLTVRGLRHGPLDDLDLDIAPGEIVGVAALAPADAAALVAALDRTATPEAGSVMIDGLDHHDLDLVHARRAVTVAHHDAPLFEGTLAAEVGSLAASATHATDAIAAAQAGEIDSIAETIAPAGDDPGTGAATGERTLGEAGRELSGGQRQRVALARALATDAAVLVLHEPTTAVDAATEHRIAAGIRAVRAGRTTVLVTTSPTLLAAADRVVLVHEGRVVADGDHATLAAGDERYRTAVLA